jgi:hypothetical protein
MYFANREILPNVFPSTSLHLRVEGGATALPWGDSS